MNQQSKDEYQCKKVECSSDFGFLTMKSTKD